MMTVIEVSKLTGVSVRTLHYYDSIGLLRPDTVTEAGYRLYDTASLERLQSILLFRELEFSLKEIKAIIDSPGFDRQKAVEQQIRLLELRRERLDELIEYARKLRFSGADIMDFKSFDKKKLEEYTEQAKREWGNTDAYREYEKKTADYSDLKNKTLASDMMTLFSEFGAMKDKDPSDEAVQMQVKRLQGFITENYYTCSDKILSGLGQMYNAGGEMTENIDAAGGKGTAEFVSRAIEIYCG